MPRGKQSIAGAFTKQLTKMVEKLKEQRTTHADALRSIDGIFEKIGITTHLAEPEPTARRGRPPGKKPGKRGPGRPAASMSGAPSGSNGKRKGRRGKRTYATSANESILAFVKEGGAKGRTSGEINAHYKGEGRAGDAYIALGGLTKTKKLKKKNMPGERGSRYTAA